MNKLEKLQTQIVARQHELAAVRAMPRAQSEVAADVVALVDAAHAAGTEALALNLQILGMASPRHENPFKFPTHGGSVNLTPMLAAVLGKDALTRALLAGAENAPAGITSDERAQRIEAITKELDELQWREAELVLETGVDPRANADPAYYILEREA